MSKNIKSTQKQSASNNRPFSETMGLLKPTIKKLSAYDAYLVAKRDNITTNRFLDIHIRSYLEEVVLEKGGAHITANIEKLEEKVLKEGSGDDCYFFAKNVTGANIFKLFKKVSEMKDDYAINMFNKNIFKGIRK